MGKGCEMGPVEYRPNLRTEVITKAAFLHQIKRYLKDFQRVYTSGRP